MLYLKVFDGSFLISEHPFRKNIFYVHFIDDDEIDHGAEFIGTFKACMIYCKQRQIQYIEREIEILKSLEEE